MLLILNYFLIVSVDEPSAMYFLFFRRVQRVKIRTVLAPLPKRRKKCQRMLKAIRYYFLTLPLIMGQGVKLLCGLMIKKNSKV